MPGNDRTDDARNQGLRDVVRNAKTQRAVPGGPQEQRPTEGAFQQAELRADGLRRNVQAPRCAVHRPFGGDGREVAQMLEAETTSRHTQGPA